MRRRTFDALLTAAGLGLAVVLLVAGGLLAWGSSFVSGQVHDQLAAQKIFFPAAGSPSFEDPDVKPFVTPYAGQQVTTGKQAQVYADHYIGAHLRAIGGGQTYAQLSAEARATPEDTELAGTVATMFKGETLRGLLLNAYAFGTMARIAAIASVVAFAGAALLLLLTGLGVRHLRRTPAEAELGAPGSWRRQPAAA